MSTDRKKVVHLITKLELGGAQGNTIHTVRHLNPTKWEAHLWCGSGGFWDKDVKSDLGKAHRLKFLQHLVRPIHPIQDILAILELKRALKELKPDILHTHSSKAGILGRIAAKWAGVPVVVHTFHGFGFHDQQSRIIRALYVFLEKWTANYAQKLIFVSKSNQVTANKLGIGNPSQYQIIRSGISLSRLKELKINPQSHEIRKKLNIPTDVKLVGTISAFKPQKNLLDFVKMAEYVSLKSPKTHFIMIGDGTERPSLEARIREKNLQNVFHMPGWIEDPMKVLASCNIFVLTSLWEGLPRALVEAIALGIPAVCYKTDGVSDLLTDIDEVVKMKDVSALSNNVNQVLKDLDHACKLIEKQSARVSNEFDIDMMVNQQETLYLHLLSQFTPS